MKKLVFLIIAVTFGLLFTNVQLTLGGESFFDMVMDKTISTTTPTKVVDLKGYKEFALLARFQGPPNGTVIFDIGQGGLGQSRITLAQETVKLNSAGWLNFAKVYRVYAPSVGLGVLNPPPNLRVRMTIYAAP